MERTNDGTSRSDGYRMHLLKTGFRKVNRVLLSRLWRQRGTPFCFLDAGQMSDLDQPRGGDGWTVKETGWAST